MNSVATLLRRRAPWMFLVSLGLSLAFGLAALLQWTPLQYLDRLAYDQLSRLAASNEDARDVQVVSIDEASLAALGQWPWPRYRVAQLLSRIAEAEPAAIAVDVLFSEPDRTSLKALQQSFQDDFGMHLSFSGVPPELQDNDGYLGYVMGQTGAVGAHFFFLDLQQPVAAGLRPGVGFSGALDALRLPKASGALDSVAPIASQTRFSGFINSQRDSDGILRRVPLLLSYQGIIHPSLALAATLRALGLNEGVVETGLAGPVLRLGGHRLPLDREGRALLRLPSAAEHYPRSRARWSSSESRPQASTTCTPRRWGRPFPASGCRRP